MKRHVCSRCRTEQPIPTHQAVKFDASVQPLCSDCWEAFRAWFFAGDRIVRYSSAPEAAAPIVFPAPASTPDSSSPSVA